MSLPYTLLGFLNWLPLTGYELKQRLDSSTQFFWHAELSQIYPALKQLEAKGLVIAETVPQEGKPDKKIYSITDAGREAFMAWLREPLDTIPPTKNPVLLKLFFSGALDKEDVLAQMRFQLEANRAHLKRIQGEMAATVRDATQMTGLERDGILWELLREYGERQAQNNIRWFEMAIKILEERY